MVIAYLYCLQCAGGDILGGLEIFKVEIYEGGLDTSSIYNRWQNLARESNLGAFALFTGIVRDENGISGLSFDVYEPILDSWFSKWQDRAKEAGGFLCMAHSRGDVLNGDSSYMSAILSSQRAVALELFDKFVEDFKHNAPIWKYDLKNGERIYAESRSHNIKGSGILG